MSSVFGDLKRQFEENKKEAGNIINDMTESEFNTRPDDKSWSAAECIGHLISTAKEYIPQLAKAEKELKLKNEKGDAVKLGFIEKYMINNLEPPAKSKFKAPGSFMPAKNNYSKEEALAGFNKSTDEFIRYAEIFEGYTTKGIKTASPVIKFIKFSMPGVLKVNAVHNRRHLWQANEAKKKIRQK